MTVLDDLERTLAEFVRARGDAIAAEIAPYLRAEFDVDDGER